MKWPRQKKETEPAFHPGVAHELEDPPVRVRRMSPKENEIARQQRRVTVYRRQNGQRVVHVVFDVGVDAEMVTSYYGKLSDLTPNQRKRFVKKFDHSTGARYEDVFNGEGF